MNGYNMTGFQGFFMLSVLVGINFLIFKTHKHHSHRKSEELEELEEELEKSVNYV